MTVKPSLGPQRLLARVRKCVLGKDFHSHPIRSHQVSQTAEQSRGRVRSSTGEVGLEEFDVVVLWDTYPRRQVSA